MIGHSSKICKEPGSVLVVQLMRANSVQSVEAKRLMALGYALVEPKIRANFVQSVEILENNCSTECEGGK